MHEFLGGAYKSQLNRRNKYGHRGKLAEALGHIVNQLWQVHLVRHLPGCAALMSPCSSLLSSAGSCAKCVRGLAHQVA